MFVTSAISSLEGNLPVLNLEIKAPTDIGGLSAFNKEIQDI